MLRPAILATALIAIAGSSIGFAQQNPGGQNTSSTQDRHGEHHYRPSAADMAAFTDARIAALRAGLELTADQAKDWPAFEQALRDAAQARMQFMQPRQAQRQEDQNAEQGQPPANPLVRLDQRADDLAKIGAALKKVADAGTPLYQSLTDAQKRRFMILARMLRPHWMRMAGGRMGRDMMGSGAMSHDMMGGSMMGPGTMGNGNHQNSDQ